MAAADAAGIVAFVIVRVAVLLPPSSPCTPVAVGGKTMRWLIINCACHTVCAVGPRTVTILDLVPGMYSPR